MGSFHFRFLRKTVVSLTAALLMLGVAHAAGAAEPAQTRFPSITGNILVEIQNDGAVASDDPAAELNDLFNTTEASLALNFNQALSIQSLTVIEPVRDPKPNKDRYFGDHGGFFEEIYLQVEFDGIRLFGGKFDAPFGTAWDAAPGIWGVDFAEDYELVERLGGGIAFTLPDAGLGHHTVTAAVFFADTTALSRSALTDRGRTRLSSGGPSNTETPESFSLAIDSEAIPGLPGATVHAAFRHQAAGIGDFAAENGVVLGVHKIFELNGGRSLTTILEGVFLDNADAGPDNRYFLTSGARLQDGPWNASLSHTARKTDIRGAGHVTDHLFQATGGYEFANGITVDGGYRFAEEDGIATHIIGFLVTKVFDVDLHD